VLAKLATRSGGEPVDGRLNGNSLDCDLRAPCHSWPAVRRAESPLRWSADISRPAWWCRCRQALETANHGDFVLLACLNRRGTLAGSP